MSTATRPVSREGLRERKKRATRVAIADAALELAAARGYDRVTVEEIADAAGVSPRTFFNYYASKDEAVLPQDGDTLTQVRSLVLQSPKHLTAVQVGTVALRWVAGNVEADADRWTVRVRLVSEQPALLARLLTTHREFERVLASALAERAGDRGAGAYLALVAAVLGASLRVSVTEWQEHGRDRRLVDVFEDHARAVAAGLPPPAPGAEHRIPLTTNRST